MNKDSSYLSMTMSQPINVTHLHFYLFTPNYDLIQYCSSHKCAKRTTRRQSWKQTGNKGLIVRTMPLVKNLGMKTRAKIKDYTGIRYIFLLKVENIEGSVYRFGWLTWHKGGIFLSYGICFICDGRHRIICSKWRIGGQIRGLRREDKGLK